MQLFMSTGHKIFSKNTLMTSITYEQKMQRTNGTIEDVNTDMVNEYVNGMLLTMKVKHDLNNKKNFLLSYVEDLFHKNETKTKERIENRKKSKGSKFQKNNNVGIGRKRKIND